MLKVTEKKSLGAKPNIDPNSPASKSVLTGTAFASSDREMEIYRFALVNLSV